MGKNNLQKENQDLKELNADLETKNKQLEQKLKNYEAIEDIETETMVRMEELEKLTAQVGTLEEAQKIVAQKQEILENVQKQAAEILNKHEELAAELKKMEEKLGYYEEADQIITDAQEKANQISVETQEKIKNIEQKAKAEVLAERQKMIAVADAQAKEIVSAAKADEAAAKKRAEAAIAEAQQSAETIEREASEMVNEFYRNKAAEGESRKAQIIREAQEERDRIVERAKTDAEMQHKSIISDAESYAQKVRENIESVRTKAEEERNICLADCEAKRVKAVSEANTIVEEGRRLREKEMADFLNAKNELAARVAEVELQKAMNEMEKNNLKQRMNSFESEIQERVRDKYAELQDNMDSLKDRYNEKVKELRGVQDRYLNIQQSLGNKALIAQFENFMQKAKEELNGESVTEDYFDQLLSIKKSYEQLLKKNKELRKSNEKLLGEKNDLQLTLSARTATENELDNEKDMSAYYKNQTKALLQELNKNQQVMREDMLRPVREVPTFLGRPNVSNGNIDFDIRNEISWLNHIKKSAERSGLYFTKRQIYAFHTAQKIHNMSPLVVLAGISGTGKSELPKNYAIYGGMHFLSIPVKPDWDSPASLFGYYNSIEKRFEATELLRAMWQMDNSYNNHMLMVLLDEMNLAHPEQYFADILSKLETSRGYETAEYDILLGGGESPERIKIGSNILWTGTMNEDETTKGLSDKVIDRSTLITFPRPRKLRSRGTDVQPQKSSFTLTTDIWQSWCSATKFGDEVMEAKIEKYKDAVESINDSMSRMGRNLGHRVWQSIEAYIRNYPEVIAKAGNELVSALDRAFNDAVACKVMPKLRGVETKGPNEDDLNRIGQIIDENAAELSEDFQNARKMNTELFQWSSAEFMNELRDENHGNESK